MLANNFVLYRFKKSVGGIEHAYRMLLEKYEVMVPLGIIGIDGRIILKLNFNKYM
jgi:hypothetical protein